MEFYKKTEIAIKALSFDKAQALKKQISITENTAVETGESKIEPLLQISFLDLLKVSLTENHLQSLLIFCVYSQSLQTPQNSFPPFLQN